MMWSGNSVKVMVVDFARKAYTHFVANPGDHTYTTGEIECGEMFAIRWAYDKTDPAKVWSVLVFEIGGTPVLVEEF